MGEKTSLEYTCSCSMIKCEGSEFTLVFPFLLMGDLLVFFFLPHLQLTLDKNVSQMTEFKCECKSLYF